jgi:hypothetical protein
MAMAGESIVLGRAAIREGYSVLFTATPRAKPAA